MAYEFDKIIDRKGTNCLKYDFARERGHSEEAVSYTHLTLPTTGDV